MRVPAGWPRAAEMLNRAGEVCRAAGLQFAYHNHVYEFAELSGTSELPYDILLSRTDPAVVKMQMDLCWFTAAGQDPLRYLRSARYPGRYISVHVKDLVRTPQWTQPITPDYRTALMHQDLAHVGEGLIDWATVLGHCRVAGVGHYYVEHDTPQVAFDGIARSFKYLAALNLRS